MFNNLNPFPAELNTILNNFLDQLSNEELKEIIQSEDLDKKIEEIKEIHPFVYNLEQKKDMLIATNRSLAEYNFKKQPSYNEVRNVLTDLHKQTQELQQKILDKQNKLEKFKSKMNPDSLRSLLQVAAQESEENSEEIAKQFLYKQKTYEEFLDEFIKARTLSHVRQIKYEKLNDSIQKSSLSKLFSNTNDSIAPSSNNLPYPTIPTSQQFNFPFNAAIQPIRTAPLPPNMPYILPPYSMSAIPNTITYPYANNQTPK